MVEESSQPSRQFALWERMYERFRLEPLPAGLVSRPGVSQIIVPTSNADELLARPIGVLVTGVTASAGLSGGLVADTVPLGRRWKLQILQALRVSGDNTLDGFLIRDTSEGVTMRIDIQTAAAELVLRFPQPMTLEETDTIQINLSGAGAGETIFSFRMWLIEEDRF